MTQQAQSLKDRVASKASGDAVANRPKSLMDQLDALVPQLTRITVDAKRADRMIRLVQTEVRRNPKLEQCDPRTLFGVTMTATQLNLEPGPLGHAYFIPYNGQVTLQLG